VSPTALVGVRSDANAIMYCKVILRRLCKRSPVVLPIETGKNRGLSRLRIACLFHSRIPMLDDPGVYRIVLAPAVMITGALTGSD
jgi:hypothetical protein